MFAVAHYERFLSLSQRELLFACGRAGDNSPRSRLLLPNPDLFVIVLRMNGQNKQSTDRLGLTGKWHGIPKEVQRPQSAIDYDRKSDKEVKQYDSQLIEYMNRKALERAEKKRRAANQDSASADNQVN